MNLDKISFCVLSNPFDKQKAPVIFLTKKNATELKDSDNSIIKEVEYMEIKELLKSIGYEETDFFTFEVIDKTSFENIPKTGIISFLKRCGLSYNKKLEKNLKESFEDFKRSIKENNNPKTNSKKHKIPEIGGEITIYFNLVLECKFTNGIPFVAINGDFFDNESTNLKNYFRPVRSTFIRTTGEEPGSIILKSTKTIEDFLEDIPFIQDGAFIISDRIQNDEEEFIEKKSYVYNFIEIKDSLAKDNRVTIKVDKASNFYTMMKQSEKIKKEYNLWINRTINIDIYYGKANEIYKVAEERMKKYAEVEEFEKAAQIKNTLKFISDKIKKMEKIKGQKIPFTKFIKQFNVR